MKIAVGLEYTGSNYHGWQKQDTTNQTVEAQLETAISRVADQPIDLVCAGRTDAGVHACHQVVHFETDSIRSNHAWKLGCNTHLPKDIRVLWATLIDETFHARFSAQSRRYFYLINNYPEPNALYHQYITWYRKRLNVESMQQGAHYLLGSHDFQSFRGSGCQAKSSIREVTAFQIKRNHHFILIDITANAFLLHMVRNIVGVLLEVGKGEQPPEWAQTVLQHYDRRKAATTAVPNGLYLHSIAYPERYKTVNQHISNSNPFFFSQFL